MISEEKSDLIRDLINESFKEEPLKEVVIYLGSLINAAIENSMKDCSREEIMAYVTKTANCLIDGMNLRLMEK
jgi:hypothetical protein